MEQRIWSIINLTALKHHNSMSRILSVLKNHSKSGIFMPPVFDWWFLTNNNLYKLTNLFKKMEQEMPIVYLAAGISSRFGGKVKQLAKVGPNGETLIELSLRQAVAAGFSKIVIILGNKTQDIKEKLGNSFQGVPIYYALQTYDSSRDRPWGTTDALCSAKSLIKSGFVVCNGDDLYGTETLRILLNHLKNKNYEATVGYTLAEALPMQGSVTRGIFKVDAKEYLTDITETFNISRLNLAENTLETLCNMNLFALHPETLALLCSASEAFKRQYQGDRKAECLLPIEIAKLIQEGKIKMKVYRAKNPWLGLTNPEDEEVLKRKLARNYSS